MYRGKRVAIIIPALNEEQAIGPVLASLPTWLDVRVVVDNGSTDRTADIAREQGATVFHEPRRGYGAACLAGLTGIAQGEKPDVVVFMDA
ncbi:MAG: glycosyltransferase, partial [Rhodospirillales bacterium]|nr:glycosyltransferase [Rhodospirillales bacterium]